MVRLAWDPSGRFVEVAVQADKPFDGALAKRVVEELQDLLRGRERLALLVDGRALRRGSLDWTLHLVTFLLANRNQLRIAIYGAGSSLEGLEGWTQATGAEVAAFRTREDALWWLEHGHPGSSLLKS